jgi:hypothetical protein
MNAMQRESVFKRGGKKSLRSLTKGCGWLVVSVAALTLSMNVPAAEIQPTWKHFRGICDASAMEMLDQDLFLVSDDEDNVLRLFSRANPGFPLASYDFSRYLGLRKKNKEIDFEGSARLGHHIFFISSHGANKKGKSQPSRHRIFAVEVSTKNDRPEIRPVGFYSNLLTDMLRTPELSRFNFGSGAALPPKEEGALNIEGLTATPEGHLLIGFRNPIPGGKALLLPILNPMQIIKGQRAQFGTATQLDLHGLGIRSLTPYRDGYLIVAGAFSGENVSQLYYWGGPGRGAFSLTEGASMPGNPEGIAVVNSSAGDVLFALSDDGTVKIRNKECKKLKDDSLKVFRAYEMPLPTQPGNQLLGRNH